ncbi:MAG: metal-dependent hydrolase [Halioglobus sp.]
MATATAQSATTANAQSSTPSDVHIKPRNRSHDIADALRGDWLDNNAFLTAFFNGMSITFPVGEKFFIDSVRHFAGDITDPVLAQQIKGFCGQEGFHRREHQQYNETLCAARGYNLDKLEQKLTQRLAWAQKTLPPITNLAVTVAIEHFTAVLAELLLRKGSILDRAEPAMRALWRWHAAEEMEHKSVAFDVYKAVGGTEAMRKTAMRRVSLLMSIELIRALLYILRKNGQLWNFKLWRAGLAGLFGDRGAFRGGWAPYTAFYANGFHPWQQDTRALLVQWASEPQTPDYAT